MNAGTWYTRARLGDILLVTNARASTTMPQTSTLVDFVLATHFETDLHLQVLDLAAWAEAFREDFPIVDQLPALARVDLAANPFQMVLSQELPLPLLRLTSADRRFYLKLQTDRFALGWNRTATPGLPDNYPGFEDMLRRWAVLNSDFENWLCTRPNFSARTRLVELVYTNIHPFPVDGTIPTLADVFSFMKPTGRRLNGFQVHWTELLDPTPTAARVSMSAGMATLGDSQPGISFSFLGFAPVSGTLTGRETRDAIETLHTRILDMYETVIISAKL